MRVLNNYIILAKNKFNPNRCLILFDLDDTCRFNRYYELYESFKEIMDNYDDYYLNVLYISRVNIQIPEIIEAYSDGYFIFDDNSTKMENERYNFKLLY